MGTTAIDVTDLCAAMRTATVEVVGDYLFYAGQAAPAHVPGFRAGSGFWIGDGAVVTANHVIARMDGVRVCVGGDCRPVTAITAWPEVDLAVLHVDGKAPAAFHLGAAVGPGQAVVAAGYPGELGYVCGPGNVTGQVDSKLPGQPFVLFEGTVAAEGSSGGHVAAVGKNPRRLEAIGAVAGATTLGDVRFDRAAPASAASGARASATPADWRHDQPWAETQSVPIKLQPGVPYWEDVSVPPMQDLDLRAEHADGLCYGFYEVPESLLGELSGENKPLAWTCDGRELLLTTRDARRVRIGLWTDHPAGWQGTVDLKRR